ncbi:MAG: BMP family ABC transporter substrate-binding protein [Chloroflexota bacterium]
MRRLFRLRFVLVALAIVASTAGVFINAVPTKAQKPVRIINVVNGTLGDKSFFDSAERGLVRAKQELGIEYKTIELTDDASRWESGLNDAMADTANYDILIAGTFSMADYMTARADMYPDKKFIMYDTGVDYTKCKCTNVYSIVYAQNEGSYLAGVYVASMIKDGKLPNLAGKHTIGAVGGEDVQVINDFIVGYEQGAKAIDPSIVMLKQYIGGNSPYFDPAKAKEIALAMYEQGADFVFGIAGNSGLGVIDAAKEKGKYAIGVDSDQATIINATDPKAAAQILTSMKKNVDNSLFFALSQDKAGKLEYGKQVTLGLAQDAVGLAVNDIYNKATPDDIKKLIDQTKADIISGKIKVDSAFEPAPAATMEATMEATAAG